MPSHTTTIPIIHSVQGKFALAYISIIAAVLLLMNTYPLLVSQEMVFQSKQNSLQSQAAVVASALAVSDSLTVQGVENTMDVLDDMGLSRIIITDPAGLVLFDTKEGEETLHHYVLFGEVATALAGQDVFHSEYREGVFHSRAATPVVYRGVIIGAVCLYENDTDQATILLSIQGNLQRISIVTCVLVLLLFFFFSKSLTRRIAALLSGMRLVREGEYSHRVAFSGQDELTQLAEEFNSLTDRLQTTEEVRRRFVSDASHELKTPLASIHLLTDSILQSDDMDPETLREFIADIGDETDRLTRISEKLLNLTRLDAKVEVPLVPVDVKKVVERVSHTLNPLIAAKEIALTTELADQCTILCTEDDLHQILFNLMENSVKYNVPQGSVVVSLQLEGEGVVVLTVQDTGVGIPEEDMPLIFNRFYRVDKARSRAAGGTGLGLSIVRDTVLQHGGTITATHGVPTGTCFTLRFPRYVEEGGAQ